MRDLVPAETTASAGTTTMPMPDQTKKYPSVTSTLAEPSRVAPLVAAAARYRHNITANGGTIMGTIIVIHMPNNAAAKPGQV